MKPAVLFVTLLFSCSAAPSAPSPARCTALDIDHIRHRTIEDLCPLEGYPPGLGVVVDDANRTCMTGCTPGCAFDDGRDWFVCVSDCGTCHPPE